MRVERVETTPISSTLSTRRPQPSGAEEVAVPPQLCNCEGLWILPPASRAAGMLRALGRAGRADREVASLDPVALIALGPLALVVLAVRFVSGTR